MMERRILFEGKVLLAGQLVDFRIYKNEDEDITYYSYDVNPEVRDVNQVGYHNGDTKQAEDLEKLLFRFNLFQEEFTKIVEQRENTSF